MRRALADPRNERSICGVSTLEIARLAAGRDIILKIPLTEWIEQTLIDLRMESMPVGHEIAVEAYRLSEPFHKDPADRQIVACGRLHVGGHLKCTSSGQIKVHHLLDANGSV